MILRSVVVLKIADLLLCRKRKLEMKNLFHLSMNSLWFKKLLS